jgi:RND family efflux transporter MFP subunit
MSTNWLHRGRVAGLAALALLAIALAFVTGCRGASKSGGDEESAPESAPQPVLVVTAANAQIAPMQNVLSVLGSTVAARHVIIRAPAAGRVMGMTLRSGDFVRKGQVVARIVNREIEAAEAGLAVAKRIDPADAAALAQSVKRYSKDEGIAIAAPDSGIVSKPPVTSGQMVADLDTLADLVDPASIYIEAAIPIGDLHLVSPGMSALVTSPLRPGAEFPARVAAMIPAFNSANATAPVRLDFTGGQTIGATDAPVEARIVTVSVPEALVVPASALFEDPGAGGFHVFVAGADGRAHRTPVTVGIRSAERAQITSGLKPGEVVITSGGYALSDGLRVSVAGGPQ